METIAMNKKLKSIVYSTMTWLEDHANLIAKFWIVLVYLMSIYMGVLMALITKHVLVAFAPLVFFMLCHAAWYLGYNWERIKENMKDE